MSKLKNIASFIYPVMIEATKGEVTPYLEVLKHNGSYQLNSLNANYSFGGLESIFDELFKDVQISKYSFRNILILGMGAGSIIYLLRKKYNIQGPITAIEKDKVVIDLAKKYFGIGDYLDLTIVNEDAFQFISQTVYTYDLVIVDLFIDDIVPEIFASHQFITNLRRISSPEACLIYNKMTDQPSHKKEFAELFEYFEQVFPGTQVLKFGVNDSENSVLFNNAMP